MHCASDGDTALLVQEPAAAYESSVKSPEDWRRIWLAKLRRTMAAHSIASLDQQLAHQCIGALLTTFSPDPYRIDFNSLGDYLGEQGPQAQAAICYFYRHVVNSPGHDTFLSQSFAHPLCSPPSPADAPAAPVPLTEAPAAATETVSPEPDRTSWLRELVERMRRDLEIRNCSQRTVVNYTRILREYLTYLNCPPGPDDADTLKEYTLHLRDICGNKPSTVNLKTAALSFFYREVLAIEPPKALRIKMKEGQHLPKVYTASELNAILNVLTHPQHRLILALAYGCGLRLNELYHLRIPDISFEEGVIWVRSGKGDKDRVVMLDDTLVPLLKASIALNPAREWLLISFQSGKRYNPRTIQTIYNNAVKKAGVQRKGGIHSLRHTFATHLHESGVDIRYLQVILGHRHSKTTEIYTHVATHKISKIRSPISGIKL